MKNALGLAAVALLLASSVGCAKKTEPVNNAPAASPAMSACCKLDAAGAHSCQHGGGGCCAGHATK
jgi:hypothetical protein